MGTNGFQEPAVGYEGGGGQGGRGTLPARASAPVSRIIGTKRLDADGKSGRSHGKAMFAQAQRRGLQAPGKEAEKNRYPFLVNNGRSNQVWQSALLDEANPFLRDRFPLPFIEMNRPPRWNAASFGATLSRSSTNRAQPEPSPGHGHGEAGGTLSDFRLPHATLPSSRRLTRRRLEKAEAKG